MRKCISVRVKSISVTVRCILFYKNTVLFISMVQRYLSILCVTNQYRRTNQLRCTYVCGSVFNLCDIKNLFNGTSTFKNSLCSSMGNISQRSLNTFKVDQNSAICVL